MAFDLSVTYTFVAGTTIVAAEHNQNMSDVEDWCSISKFAGTSDPTGPSEGQWFYRTDENQPYFYNGSSWDQVRVYQVNTTTKSTTCTLTIAESGQVEVTASSPWTCTLPAAKKGLCYVFKKTDGNSNAITIIADGSDTIDGVSSKSDVLIAQYDEYAVVGNDAEDGWNGYGG